jgi:cardiolipin synthase A/B
MAYWDSFLKVQLIVVHCLGVLNAVHAAFKVRTPQSAIGWAIGLITFPYFAIPLYWTFGRAKFIGYRCAGKETDGPLHDAATEAAAGAAPYVLEPTPTRALERWRKLLTTLPTTHGNHVELLVDGDATFQAIFAAFDSARDYLLVQFFIIHADEIGMEFQRRLIERAQAGVKIRLLYDEVGCHKLPRSYLKTLCDAGIRAEGFKTTRGAGNRFQINFRNHRKLVIADGREALTGGLNVGDEYLGRSKRFGPWRDTHVRVRGPAVQAAQLAFAEDWHFATGEVPPLNWTPTSDPMNQNALVLATGPADDAELCSLAFIRAVNSAQHRLWISSPYFVPDATVLTALQLAALRGVEVRILLPQEIDHLLPMLSSFSYYSTLEQAGIQLWRYQNGFLHQKALLIDDAMGAIGSVNVDYRSFHLNFELVVMVSDTNFAAQTEAMLQADFACAKRIDLNEYKTKPWWFKFAVRLARLLSPVE